MLILVAALSLLGRWQWDVSQSQRGGLQNLLYAFQWWFMAGMVIYGWARLLHDEAHPKATTEAPARGESPAAEGLSKALAGEEPWTYRTATSDLIDAQLAVADDGAKAGETDEELVEYNQYLAFLNARAERAQ